MKRLFTAFAVSLLLTLAAQAQNPAVRPVRTWTGSAPSTCSVGEEGVNTTSHVRYFCNIANTWTTAGTVSLAADRIPYGTGTGVTSSANLVFTDVGDSNPDRALILSTPGYQQLQFADTGYAGSSGNHTFSWITTDNAGHGGLQWDNETDDITNDWPFLLRGGWHVADQNTVPLYRANIYITGYGANGAIAPQNLFSVDTDFQSTRGSGTTGFEALMVVQKSTGRDPTDNNPDGFVGGFPNSTYAAGVNVPSATGPGAIFHVVNPAYDDLGGNYYGARPETFPVLLLEGLAGQTANLIDAKLTGGSDVFSVSPAGLATAASYALANGGALKTDATSGHTLVIQGYDNNTGPGYVTFATITNGNTPSLAISAPAGGATVSISTTTLTLPTQACPMGQTAPLIIDSTGAVTKGSCS